MSEGNPFYVRSMPDEPARNKPLAYPQPTNFLIDPPVSIAEPSLERIRVLVEETVRRVLHEEDEPEQEDFVHLPERRVIIAQATTPRSATVECEYNGVRYRGTVYEVPE